MLTAMFLLVAYGAAAVLFVAWFGWMWWDGVIEADMWLLCLLAAACWPFFLLLMLAQQDLPDGRRVYRMDCVMRDVADWQRRQFPNATAAGARAHQRRELKEINEEFADYAIMAIQEMWTSNADDKDAFNLCLDKLVRLDDTLTGMGLGFDLVDAIEAKMAKNAVRGWPSQPDAEGVYQHINEGPTS